MGCCQEKKEAVVTRKVYVDGKQIEVFLDKEDVEAERQLFASKKMNGLQTFGTRKKRGTPNKSWKKRVGKIG